MKRGIAFSGGGLRGAYQVGAYKAFLDAHVKADGFVGTSIGSFNAAMCASGRFKELYDFWYNLDAGAILGFSEKLVSKTNNEDYDLEMLNEILNNIKSIVLNKGISTINLRKLLEKLNIGKDLYYSNKDFGLVTVRFNDFKPKYLFKEEIPKDKLNDYLIASCFLPIFKFETINLLNIVESILATPSPIFNVFTTLLPKIEFPIVVTESGIVISLIVFFASEFR